MRRETESGIWLKQQLVAAGVADQVISLSVRYCRKVY